MEKKINECLLRISGSAAIDRELDTTKTVILKNAELDIYKEELLDQQDGTYNKKYTGRFSSAIEFEQGGEKIVGTDKTSNSVQNRQAIRNYAISILHAEPDDFYDIFSDKMRKNIGAVWLLLKDK